MNQDRIAAKFSQMEKESRTGLIPYLTVGYPDRDATLELVPALAQAGADCIELGVPFSDPLADGVTIQASSFQALQNGITLEGCIELVGELRDLVPDTPLVFMGYYNPIFSYGLPKFARSAAAAGLDGLIVPDLPPEESGPLREQCGSADIDVIPMLAPTSTDARIEMACGVASGFIYCVSLTGVTGERDQLPPGVFSLLDRVRRHTTLPLAVGFGISRREHVDSVGGQAHAVIVGSALIRVIMESPRSEIVDRAQRFVQGLTGAVPSVGGGGR